MHLTAKKIYCFIEQYESQISTTLSATFSWWLISLYFKHRDNGDPNFGHLTREQEKKLQKSNRRISRALRLSKSQVGKLRGGSSYPITPITHKLIATKVAIMTLNAAKDGSIHAVLLLVLCKVSPKSKNFIKTICLGGNTDALVNEIAKNLQTHRQQILQLLFTNNEIRENLSNLLLELDLIKAPLTRVDLVRLSAYGISVFEIPIVKGAILGCRGVILMLLTKKIQQIIVSELSGEIARGVLVAIFSMLSGSDGGTLCGVDVTEIQKLKQALMSRSTCKGIIAPEGPKNILHPTFNDEIIDFIEIDPVVERLTGSPFFKNPLIHYSPKFNVNYVMERLVIGHDITKLPRDHITNLW